MPKCLLLEPLTCPALSFSCIRRDVWSFDRDTGWPVPATSCDRAHPDRVATPATATRHVIPSALEHRGHGLCPLACPCPGEPRAARASSGVFDVVDIYHMNKHTVREMRDAHDARPLEAFPLPFPFGPACGFSLCLAACWMELSWMRRSE